MTQLLPRWAWPLAIIAGLVVPMLFGALLERVLR